MREETRILVEEVGLEEFEKLERLRFRMNRAYLLDQCICPYLAELSPDTSKLKILDLADNALGSRDVRTILESIEFLPLTELDLSFN